MEIINQLLKNTPQQLRESYKSHLRLHMKLIMTNINKAKLQDLTKVEVRKNKCILNCYQKTQNLLKPNPQGNQSGSQTKTPSLQQTGGNEQLVVAVQQLKDCKKSCKKEQHAVTKHLDDVNFFSKRKFGGCSSKCERKFQQFVEQQKRKGSVASVQIERNLHKPYNECMWDCYNRLDRRYKDYWKKQQEEVIKEFL